MLAIIGGSSEWKRMAETVDWGASEFVQKLGSDIDIYGVGGNSPPFIGTKFSDTGWMGFANVTEIARFLQDYEQSMISKGKK